MAVFEAVLREPASHVQLSSLLLANVHLRLEFCFAHVLHWSWLAKWIKTVHAGLFRPVETKADGVAVLWYLLDSLHLTCPDAFHRGH